VPPAEFDAGGFVVDPLDGFAFSTMALLFQFAFARELLALLPLGWPHSCIAITTVKDCG